jgi:small subunit ribosomal protein S6
MNVRHYETVFILNPVLSNEQVEDTINKFRKFILEQDIEIVFEEAIGLKKLAYPIQHKHTGIYHLIEFKAKPEFLITLETAYKRDENVIRFLTFSLDKHGLDYNERKRLGTLNNKQVEKNTKTMKEVTA